MTDGRLSHSLLKEVGFSLLAEGRTIKVRADGFSMYPGIKPRSVIFIEPIQDFSDLSPGDIIAWKRDSGFVVHRLVRIFREEEETFVVTRGDSSLYEDDPVTADLIAGKVVKVEDPRGRPVSMERILNKKPNYCLNRFLLRIILQISRIKRFFSSPSPSQGG